MTVHIDLYRNRMETFTPFYVERYGVVVLKA
jgi:hypothetical protein